jgi:hypothetical protein
LNVAPASVILLGSQRRKGMIEIDLYNTSKETQRANLRGALIGNTPITRADMLGINRQRLKGHTVVLAPLEFAKVLINDRRNAAAAPSR